MGFKGSKLELGDGIAIRRKQTTLALGPSSHVSFFISIPSFTCTLGKIYQNEYIGRGLVAHSKQSVLIFLRSYEK